MKYPAQPLDTEAIDKTVSRYAIGAYRLYKETDSSIQLAYWGRSDTSLRRRLKEHARKGTYTHFTTEIAETIFEAFRRECRDYHLRIPDIDNQMHPSPPRNLPYSCLYCVAMPNAHRYLSRVVS